MKKIVLLALLLFPVLALTQAIPSGYVQATATVPILANGYFGAAWTNLSSSPQLGLLGCVSTFQTTVNGTIDSYGKFSVLLADPAQICPSPSTWTFTFSCHTPPGAFIIPITVAGGGSVDDISAQITAAAPTNVCNGGGGGGSFFAYVNGTALKQLGSVNFADSATATFSNPNTNVVQVTANPGLVVQVNGVPISPASPANFVDTASVTWAFTGGQILATAVGGGTGTCGPLANDATSTNCGNDNQTGNTATDVQTFGYTNANMFAAANKVGIGAGNFNVSNELSISTPMVGEGYNNFTFDGGTIESNANWLYAFGNSNFNGTQAGDDITIREVTAIGDTNICGNQWGTTTIEDSYFLGETNDCFDGTGTMTQHNILAMGDTSFNPTFGTATNSYADFVVLGDEAADMGETGHDDTSNDVIAIGDEAISGYSLVDNIAIGNHPGSGNASNDVIAVGDYALVNYNGAHDLIGIGDEALVGQASLVNATSGHDLVAIGDHALACNSTGNDNLALGDYAGAIGFSSPSSCGNSNKSGSNNVWIGNQAGPDTATQLSNTIAIGYQAYNTASNQIVLGNSSTTQAVINGTIQTPALLSAPCVGTDGSGNFVSNPGCTGGGSFTYPSGTGIVTVAGGAAWGTTLGVGASANNIPQLDGSGLLLPAVLPLATATTFGAVEVDNTTITASGGVISAVAGAPAFSAVTAGTNAHALLMGTGGSLGVSGSGTIAATTAVNLASYPTLCSGGQFSQGLSSGSNNCANPAGGGTVTSVGLVLPSGVFAISGSPVTGSGNLIGSFQTQTANLVFAGPSSGSAAAPTFRALVSADLPPTSLASNLAGGALGSIPYQSATNGTSMLPGVTTAGQTFILSEQPGGSLIAPQWLNLGTYLASPPAIGGTAPAAAFFTTINGHNLPANTTTTVAGGTTVPATGKLLMPPITMSGVGSGCTVTFTPTTDMTTVGGWSPGQMLAPLPFGLTSNQINWYLINNTGSNITTAASVTFVVSAKC